MALGQPTVRDRRLDPGREVEQAERVRDGRSGPADPRRDLVLAEAELVDELSVGLRRLERIEVLALEVLDEGELELVAVGELADDRRDAFEAGGLRGPEATLAGDELVAVDRLGHEDRLEDAVLGDARGQRSPGSSASNRLRGWCGFALDAADRDLDGRRPGRRCAAG